MEMLNLLNEVILALLVIPPTIFVLGVTLLGSAVEKSRQEEKAARESESVEIKEEIEKIEEELKKAKKNGDTTNIYKNLEELKKRQEQTENKISKIKIKYNSINLLNTVVIPVGLFILILLINKININYLLKYKYIFISIIIFEILLVIYSLFKLYKSLKLIEEISVNKKESDYFDHITESFKLALVQHEQDKKEDIEIEFVKKSFPLNVVCSAELIIDFKVGIKRGSILNNVEVWFFIPDEFGLINPSESESWRQSSEYVVPNIRTIKKHIGKVSIGAFVPRSIKIKTPDVSGNYSIRYSIKGDGYDGKTKELKLIVG